MAQNHSIKVNEEGSALVLSMMVLLVLSLLGTALATATMGQHQLNAQNRSSVAAYYAAEGVINEKYNDIETMVYQEYEKHSNKDSFFLAVDNRIQEIEESNLHKDYSSNFNENPETSVDISQSVQVDDSLHYIMTVEGQVGKRTREVSQSFIINWQDKSGGGVALPPIPENTAGIVKNSMELKGNLIEGDMYFYSTSPESVYVRNGTNLRGSIFHPSSIEDGKQLLRSGSIDATFESSNDLIPWDSYQSLANSFPSIPSYHYPSGQQISDGHSYHDVIKNGVLKLDHWLVDRYYTGLKMDENIEFSEIFINGDKHLTIDPQGQTWDIVVDHLNINGDGGHIDIVGKGTINLYIRDQFTFTQGTLNSSGDPNQLNIYYAGKSSVRFSGGYHLMSGSIFVKDAPMYFSNTSNINGFILTGGSYVEYDGGSNHNTILIAPFAQTNIIRGTIKGIVITENLLIENGGGQILHPEISLNSFPFSNQDGEETDTKVELIYRGALKQE